MLLPQRLIDFAEELENGNDPHATALGLRGLSELHGGVYGKVADAIRAEKDRLTDYCEVTVTVQAGRPVLTRITTTHKPGAEVEAPADQWLTYPPVNSRPVDLSGCTCYGGISMAGHGKELALVLLFPPDSDDDPWRVRHWVWAKGSDEGAPAIVFREVASRYAVVEVGFDPRESGRTVPILDNAGLTAIEVQQNFRTMTEPIRHLQELTRQRHIVSEMPHPPGIGRVALMEDANGNRRPDSGQSTGLASPILSLLNAMSRALVHTKAE